MRIDPLRLAGLAVLALSVCVAAAQDGKKPPRKEEEDDDPPPAKVKPKPRDRKEDEEDTRPKAGKSPVLDVEDDEKGKTPTPRPAADLASAAREATHPAIKALYADLATPADTLEVWVDVSLKKKEVLRVRPIAAFYADRKEIKEALTVETLKGDERTIQPHAVLALKYYEQAAAEEVRKFLDGGFDALPATNAFRLERYQMLVAAETALAAVIRSHQSATERGVRAGAGWLALEQALRRQLVDALLGQLDKLVENKAWGPAFELTRRLADAAPRVPGPESARVTKAVSAFLEKALADPAFSGVRLADIRERGQQLESLFPGSGVFGPIKEKCQNKAADLLARAKALAKEADDLDKGGMKKEAAEKRSQADGALRDAQEIWPWLPGLPAALERVAGGALRVGGRELPELMSPARAVTEADHRALDLLYESLAQLVPDQQGRLYYRNQLALGRPEILPLARRFVLPVGAKWSNGNDMHTAAAIRSTVKWLTTDKTPGRLAAMGDMLSEKVALGGRADVVAVQLRRGAADPMSFMTFKIVPDGHKTEAFAKKPFGSGPFAFSKFDTLPKIGRKYASFLRNDHYGVHAGRLGQPYISEIQYSAPPDTAEALIRNEIDLALDLTGAQAGRLKKAGFTVPTPKPGVNNRRIHFLAINHRQRLLQEPAMRQALARAIPREKILDKVYRKELGWPAHVALNGPYPLMSWASEPELVTRDGKPHSDPFDADLAKAKFKEALKKAGVGEATMKLKYPEGDKELDAAMKQVCDEVMESLPGLTLRAEAVKPEAFRRDVEEAHDFDLAYGYHDYAEGAFWLAPLLEAGPGGGENWMGYTGPLLRDAQMSVDVRYFPEARAKAREIHRKFLGQEMPFIPLWQLTPLMAWKAGVLDMPPLDAGRPFARIAEWKVKRGG